MKYYMWCPECKTASCWSINGSDEEHAEYACQCDVRQVGWETIRTFFKGAPPYPQKNVIYDYSKIDIELDPLIIKVLCEADMVIGEHYYNGDPSADILATIPF